MKVKELVALLQQVEDQNREVSVVIGNEDCNSFVSDDIEIHNLDNETSLEIFCFDNHELEC